MKMYDLFSRQPDNVDHVHYSRFFLDARAHNLDDPLDVSRIYADLLGSGSING